MQQRLSCYVIPTLPPLFQLLAATIHSLFLQRLAFPPCCPLHSFVVTSTLISLFSFLFRSHSFIHSPRKWDASCGRCQYHNFLTTTWVQDPERWLTSDASMYDYETRLRCPVGGTLPSLYEVTEMCSMFETSYWVWRATLCLSTGYYTALSPPGTKFGKLRVWLCDAQSSQNMVAQTGCAGLLVHSTTEQPKSGRTPTQSPSFFLPSFLPSFAPCFLSSLFFFFFIYIFQSLFLSAFLHPHL